MTANPNELTIEYTGCAIEHQPWVAFGVESIDRGVLINTPIGRTTTAAWSDPNLRAAVEATGRTKLIMAGAKPINWAAVSAEWAPDFTSPARNVLNEVVLQHGGGAALAAEYVIAQLSAGLVPAPTWATEPEPAR